MIYISRMMFPMGHMSTKIAPWHYMDNKTIFVFICALLGMGFIKRFVPEKIRERWSGSVIEAAYCVCILILCLAAVANDTYNPFIYFQF